jgi:hypothetical protein
MAKSIRAFLLALAASVALFTLTACDMPGAAATPTPATTRPTATTEAVKPHTLRPRATPTDIVVVNEEPTEEVQVEEPTAEPDQDFGIVYATYTGKNGDWSVDYPDDWQVSEDDPNVQFIEPAGEAFIQVTSSEMDSSNTNEDLVQIAGEQLAQAFGPTYLEQGREKQSDGSYRIDFTFTADNADWVAQTFVEGRQSNLYMLFLATSQAEEQSDKYTSIFTHVIDSYVLPEQ